ncbi:MAG TPA: NYN domain-containing protein, partial [Ktedonobacterales bacterium]|nr:NYN domain-containing protein [Ktedonobacterales bacterium]
SAIDVEAPETAEIPEVIDAAATEEPAEEPAVAIEAAAEEADQSEHDSASRRRRRRGRRGHGQDVESGESEVDDHQSPSASRLPAPYAAPETRVTYARDHESSNNGYQPTPEGFEESGYGPYTPAVRGRGSRSVTPSRSATPPAPSAPAARNAETSWDMPTAQHHMQESASPFGSPEPSFAHGFGPQSSGVASPLHEPLPRIRRGERSGDVPMSANQLGTIITSAITQQTDRLLSELRRQQYPPSMTVALPAFPSTERIGVFVDVANLLYSARSQRMNIDFGRLLDFLRANRRLIRAHAYAPTNPDPHAEQTFLSAVKGVGYRITTKNYKTFASGARKADMDLDLCMDIVRMVDADAIDTVILVSGDSDFLPLLEYCSDHGVRVEVAAFDDAAAMILRQSCDLFINLSQVDEIRV